MFIIPAQSSHVTIVNFPPRLKDHFTSIRKLTLLLIQSAFVKCAGMYALANRRSKPTCLTLTTISCISARTATSAARA